MSYNHASKQFFDELKEKINHYFSSNSLKRTGNYNLYIKSFVLIVSVIISYILLLFFSLPVWCSIILCALLGVLFAGIGFNIMHDAAHGSFSSKKWLNELMGYSLNLMGGNVFIWKNKHNVNHHSYTNIDGMDDDINIEPWIRTHLNQKKRWYHRYQHVYWIGFYGITYFYWVFVNDFKKYFSKRIANTELRKMDTREHFIFWISKLAYIFLFLIFPIFKVGFWEAIIGYSILAFICGFILSVIFQLAHIVRDAEFPLLDENSKKVQSDWALHQIATTANFSVKNKLMFAYTGGLNFQIVHHIFPKISHIHYPKINELIKEVCCQRSIKYIEYPSFFNAMRSHISHLRHVGRS